MRAMHTEIIARAVIHHSGRILLARQRGKPWSFLPGGHVEPGEPVEQALMRELVEELGVEGKISRFLGAVEHGYAEGGKTHHEINLVFEVTLDAEPIGQEEHLEFHWLPLDQLADADLRPSSVINGLVEGGTFWRGWAR
jgi:8-oxo-dGTP pyrophosphatase MutT (NUDIX family)